MMARDGLTGNKDFAGGERIRTVGDDLKAPAVKAGGSGVSGASGSAGAAAAMPSGQKQ